MSEYHVVVGREPIAPRAAHALRGDWPLERVSSPF